MDGGVGATSFSGEWPPGPEKDGFFNMPVSRLLAGGIVGLGGVMRTFRSDICVVRFVDGRRLLYFHRHFVVAS